MNTARTACVVLAPGCNIPYAFDISIVKSLIIGKFTSIPFIPLNSIFYLIVRNHGMCA